MIVFKLFGKTYGFGPVKKCTNKKCQSYHFVEDFYPDRTGNTKDGLMSWCKTCCYRNDFNRVSRQLTELSKPKVKKQLKKLSKSFK